MRDLSVIVPTHDRRDLLPGLLASLAAQDHPADRWELIVVDDGSSDGTREYLEAGRGPRPAGTVVLSQPQSGPSAARNRGAGLARGRALLFLDDDMIASPALVGEHARAHLEHSWAVVLGHFTAPAEGREAWHAWEDAQLARHFEALASGRRPPGRRDLYSGNCSVSAELFRAVSGYDTSLLRAEDVELGYRLEAAGARFLYREAAQSLHLGRHSFESWRRHARMYGEADLTLAWEKGHLELQQEIFRWYRQRNPLNRGLVQLCSRLPSLEAPLVALLDLAGRAAWRGGLSRPSRASYSVIFNLAYWLAIIEGLGRGPFWERVGRGEEDPPRSGAGRPDALPSKAASS